MGDLENEDDFGTRRRKAIFDDDGADDEGDEETEDTEDDEDEDNEDGEDKQYTEIELKAEREDLLGRKVYTEDSIEDFISALKDGEEYDEAINTHLKLMPDESEEDKPQVSDAEADLAKEFPEMTKQMAEQEKSSSEEFPKMDKDMKKKKN